MKLPAVADCVKEVLPHQWEVPCPLVDVAEPHLYNEWFDEMAAKKKAFEQNSPPVG